MRLVKLSQFLARHRIVGQFRTGGQELQCVFSAGGIAQTIQHHRLRSIQLCHLRRLGKTFESVIKHGPRLLEQLLISGRIAPVFGIGRRSGGLKSKRGIDRDILRLLHQEILARCYHLVGITVMEFPVQFQVAKRSIIWRKLAGLGDCVLCIRILPERFKADRFLLKRLRQVRL